MHKKGSRLEFPGQSIFSALVLVELAPPSAIYKFKIHSCTKNVSGSSLCLLSPIHIGAQCAPYVRLRASLMHPPHMATNTGSADSSLW